MPPGKIAPLLILFLAAGCRESSLAPPPEHLPEMKGFTYTSFSSDGFTRGGASGALGDLAAQVGNSWVSLVVFEYQSTPVSTEMGPNTDGVNPLTGGPWPTSSTESDLREAIREARLRDLRIMIKPHIDLYDGEWRAAILPDDGGRWFASYGNMMMKYARLCEEAGVELLCIGDEYVVATQPRYTCRWRELIAALRGVYRGKLTYAANWSGAVPYGLSQPEFRQVEFWNDLDYIGVDTYYPLASSAADTLPPFAGALGQMLAYTPPFAALFNAYGRPVVITETGLQSVRGALAAPWDYALGASPQAVEDTSAQALYYDVMIAAFGNQPWCAGIFWWNWESVPSPNASTNYTPKDKPASRRLRQWYLRVPA